MLSKLLIDKTKPQAKSVRLSDGRGMYLEISPAGGKWWRFKYRFAGKERRISLGVYPDVPLAAAREKREEARRQVAAGIDPGEQRKAAKVALVESTENTFEAIAREWFGMFSTRWVKGHADKIIRRLELNVFPWLGSRPIKAITAPELLAVLRRVESRGANETAHRALQVCGRVFRYAIATGRAERDPSRDLSGALAPIQERHFASITEPLAVGELLRAIDAYKGAFVTRCALRLAPLVFVRPGELRAAQWAEFDFDKSEWRIPASPHEGARTAHRSAVDSGRGHPSRTAAAHRSVSLRLPERPQSLPGHERECHHRRASPYGLHRPGHDRPRIPQHGLDLAQRAGLESRCHRAAAGARGARRRAGGLQLRRTPAGAAAHDAGVGGLFGETQEWIGRRRALSESRRLGAEHLSNRWGVAPAGISPYRRGPVRADVSFSRCPKSAQRLMRTSSSKRFRCRRRASRSPTYLVVHGTPNLPADQWSGRSVARAKKGRAVPTQCADWIFARGRAAAFILLSLVSKATHGNS